MCGSRKRVPVVSIALYSFRGAVPHAHEPHGKEDTGEGVEPALCAVLVTGCAEQQERHPQQRKQQQWSRSSSPSRYASGSHVSKMEHRCNESTKVLAFIHQAVSKKGMQV